MVKTKLGRQLARLTTSKWEQFGAPDMIKGLKDNENYVVARFGNTTNKVAIECYTRADREGGRKCAISYVDIAEKAGILFVLNQSGYRVDDRTVALKPRVAVAGE